MFDKTLEIKPNNGNQRIEDELLDTRIKALNSKNLALQILEQGITVADISWWNGLSEQKKEKIRASEYATSGAWLKSFAKQGIVQPEEQLHRLDKVMSEYSDYPLPDITLQKCDRLGYSKEDYPLPWQLQKRCSKFAFRCFITGRKKWFKETSEQFRTMNAFFRAQIREGKI